MKDTITLEISYTKETSKSGDPYLWLDPNAPRRKILDTQTIENIIALSKSCVFKDESEEVYNLLVKYREASSLRDEISTCPNIDVDLLVIDKSSFFMTLSYQRGRQTYDR